MKFCYFFVTFFKASEPLFALSYPQKILDNLSDFAGKVVCKMKLEPSLNCCMMTRTPRLCK